MYAIPYEDKWTVIINKDTDSWGSFKYDPSKDVVRIELPVTREENTAEYFSAAFEKNGKGILLKMKWDTIAVSLPFSL